MCTGLGLGPSQGVVEGFLDSAHRLTCCWQRLPGPSTREASSWSLEAWESLNMVAQTAQSERKAEEGLLPTPCSGLSAPQHVYRR